MNERRMHRNAKWIVAIMVFVGMLSSWASATTVSFRYGGANIFTGDNVYTGTQDTFIWQLTGTATWGGHSEMFVGRDSFGYSTRALLRFDLSSFAGQYASVTSLTLRLTMSTAASLTGTGTVHWISAANKDWVAGMADGSAQNGSACWNWRQYDTNAWAGSAGLSTAATDYDSTVLGTFTWTTSEAIGTVRDIAITGTTEQLTALVALMTNGNSNAGFLLRSDVDQPNHQVYFATAENSATSKRPCLFIGYILPATPSVSTIAVTYRDGATNRFTSGSAYTGTADTWMWTMANTANYGGRTDLWVGQSGGVNGFIHTLMRFDLSSFAGQYTSVTGITLRLTTSSTASLAGTGVVYWISATNKVWVEGTADGVPENGSPCWLWRQYNTNAWAGSGGLSTEDVDYYSLMPLGTFTWAASEAAGTTHDIVFQGTPAELMWLVGRMANASLNAGFLIRGLVESATDTASQLAFFASSEYATVNYRPQLTINYRPPSGAIFSFR